MIEMADVDKVFTRDELIDELASFTNGLTEAAKADIDPKALASLEAVSQGINQAYDRIENLNATVADLSGAAEDYRKKIAALVAQEADRMRRSVEPEPEDNPAQDVIDKINDSEGEGE